MALANLAVAFPGLTEGDRRRIARQSFQHAGLVLMELCALLCRPVDQALAGVTIEGGDHLAATMRERGRALLLTAHLGNWELLAAAHVLCGYPLSTVVRPLDSPWLDAVARRLRERFGAEIIAKRDALRPILRALAAGRLVGILLDQNAARREGVFVPFFGRAASTSRSLAVLSLRTRTAVLPVFIRRESPGRHRVEFLPPIEPHGGERAEEAIRDLTARYTAVVEVAIRRTPEQWLWMHDRWRTRPRAVEPGT